MTFKTLLLITMSWERSRFIPWSKLDIVSGNDGYESQKERIFRTLQKEANREKELLERSKSQGLTAVAGIEDNSSNGGHVIPTFVPPEVLAQQNQKEKGLFNSGVDYSTPDLIRSLAFGRYNMHYSQYTSMHLIINSLIMYLFVFLQVDVSAPSLAVYLASWTV